jgi:hypothetical protein
MNLIERIKNILVTPKTEWNVIAAEEQPIATVYTTYVLPLSIIGAAAALLGWGLIGKSYGTFLGSFTVKGFDIGIKYAIISLVSSAISFFVTSFVMDALAPSFGSEKNLNKSAQLVGYSYTPALIGAILGILPSLALIGSLVGLYGIYLMYLGIGPLKKTPDDKKVVYMIVSFVILLAVSIVLGLILVSVLGLGGAPNINIG